MVVLVVVDRGGGWSWCSRSIGGNGHVGVVLIVVVEKRNGRTNLNL